MNFQRISWGVLIFSLLGGCETSRYHLSRDTAPDGQFDASSVPDAVPIYEQRTIAGNKSPYSVDGETYHVMPSAEGYVEEGVASWYGKKFHGYKTANGETYNMYGMTAAHKELPIPSYVRVTNLANKRQVVVRVNDRGPFHSDRIMDLSYAAALRLGIVENGTGRVRLEALSMPEPGSVVGKTESASQLSHLSGEKYVLQAGAFSSQEAAEQFRLKLKSQLDVKVEVRKSDVDNQVWYRVFVGPVANKAVAEHLRYQLTQSGFPKPIVLPETAPKPSGG